MPIKSVKMKISKKMCFFLMSQGSFNPKIRFLGQRVCPVARSHTHRHTDRVTTEGTLSGFQDVFPSTYHQGSAQLYKQVRSLDAKEAVASIDV